MLLRLELRLSILIGSGGGMTAWLLSWNPKNWEWDTFFRERAITASGRPVEDTWSCANSAAAKGDTVYLVRTGDEPRGIIARGVITQNPFEKAHYDPARAAKGETRQVVGINFDDIRDPDQDEFLSIQTLENDIDREQTWTPQSSGIAINERAAKELESRWQQLPKPDVKPIGVILPQDIRVLGKYETASQGAWKNMPQVDKAAYLRIHRGLEQILVTTFENLSSDFLLDNCLTLGFSPTGGVRGNRPKDLWCAVFPRGAEAYMPQVYLIISHRGVELGYAAANHPIDFSNQDFKLKLKQLAPRIFDALPSPTSTDVHQLSEKLSDQTGWYFRQKTRLQPKENDFGQLENLLSFLKSAEGSDLLIPFLVRTNDAKVEQLLDRSADHFCDEVCCCQPASKLRRRLRCPSNSKRCFRATPLLAVATQIRLTVQS
jgi:hypothetical protein